MKNWFRESLTPWKFGSSPWKFGSIKFGRLPKRSQVPSIPKLSHLWPVISVYGHSMSGTLKVQTFPQYIRSGWFTSNTDHGVMGFSDILQQGMGFLRTDGAQNCTCYLFQNCSFHATARATMKHLSLRSSCFIASLTTRGKNLEIFLMNIEYFSVCSCKIKQTIKLWHNNFMWNN